MEWDISDSPLLPLFIEGRPQATRDPVHSSFISTTLSAAVDLESEVSGSPSLLHNRPDI